jgi:hypothetical protein
MSIKGRNTFGKICETGEGSCFVIYVKGLNGSDNGKDNDDEL